MRAIQYVVGGMCARLFLVHVHMGVCSRRGIVHKVICGFDVCLHDKWIMSGCLVVGVAATMQHQ